MPLTDEVKAVIGDKFNEDQLAEMLTPEVQTRLGSTHVIRTKEDDESYVSSKAKELKDAEIGSHVGTLHQFYEDQLLSLGYKKNPNEKTSDMQKRVLADLKVKADQATGGDEALRQQISQLTANMESLKTEKDTEVSTLKEKYFKKQVDGLLSSTLASVNIALPTTVKTDAEKQSFADSTRDLLKTKLATNYTIKEDNDGNVVFYKGDQLQMSATNGKPLTANEIVLRDFPSYIDASSKQAGGAGSSSQGSQGGNFATKKEVYEHLEANGYEKGSNRLTQAAIKIIKEQGILD